MRKPMSLCAVNLKEDVYRIHGWERTGGRRMVMMMMRNERVVNKVLNLTLLLSFLLMIIIGKQDGVVSPFGDFESTIVGFGRCVCVAKLFNFGENGGGYIKP